MKEKYVMVVLTIINLAFFVMGLWMIAVGVLALKDVSNINRDQIKPLMDLITMDFAKNDSMTMFRSLCISIIVAGGLQLVVMGLGVGGTCYGNKQARFTYASLIATMFVTKIVVIIMWGLMKSEVDMEIKNKMIEVFKDDFKDDTITNENSISNAWNHLFIKLECCGVNSVVSTTNDFDGTPWCMSSGTCLNASSQIPRTCCKNIGESTYIFAPSDCYVKVVSGTFNGQGCYDALKEKLLSQSTRIISAILITIVLDICAFCCAVWISRQAY